MVLFWSTQVFFFGYKWLCWVLFCLSRLFLVVFVTDLFSTKRSWWCKLDSSKYTVTKIKWQKWSIFILKTFIFLINRNGRISSIINITGFVHHNLAFKPFYTCISCQYISFTNRKLIYQIIWIAVFESHLLNGYKCYRSWLKCFRSERNWYYWMFSLITS